MKQLSRTEISIVLQRMRSRTRSEPNRHALKQAENIVLAPPAKPAVRFVVHTVHSESDRNGNRYHWSRIVSSVSGRVLTVKDASETGVSRRVSSALRDLGGGTGYSPEIEAFDATLPLRQFNASEPRGLGGIEPSLVYESQLTPEMIISLEQHS